MLTTPEQTGIISQVLFEVLLQPVQGALKPPSWTCLSHCAMSSGPIADDPVDVDL